MRVRPLIGIAMCVLVVALDGQQAPSAAIRIQFPREGDYVSGAVTITAMIVSAASPVQRVSFFVGGALVCAVERPPYECQWNAGPTVDEHQIRVVAQLSDGSRLVDSIRTRGGGYTETVHVEAIEVPVTVTDGRGRFVHDLPKEAFRVYENDAVQRIEGFVPKNSALEVIAGTDVSGSMQQAIPTLKKAVKQFCRALRPSDKLTLMGFNDTPFLVARPGADPALRERNIDKMDAFGRTALYDFIVTAIDTLGRQSGRRALVVFSDGEDTASKVPREVAEGRVEASDAVVFSIGQGRGTKLKPLQTILEGFAKVSGGRAIFTDSPDELGEAFAEIIDELSNQYLLGYEPTNPARDGAWRRIRVEVTDKKLKVRAREGYRAVKR